MDEGSEINASAKKIGVGEGHCDYKQSSYS
jgi:hypothetical protein